MIQQLVLTFLMCLSSYLFVAQNVYIPNPPFKAALINDGVDTNGDGEISFQEAEQILTLNVGYEQITSLKGIEAFINLDSLSCDGNKFQQLDLSQNVELEYLDCSQNDLTILEVFNNTKLRYLDCAGLRIEELDLAQLPNLEYLDCSFNELEELDLSSNQLLTYIKCRYNDVYELDIEHLSDLTFLDCRSNRLSALDLSKCFNLEHVDISTNTQLGITDVSQNSLLKELRCSEIGLSSLDITNNPLLVRLEISYNSMVEIDLSRNTKLEYFLGSSSDIEALDFSNCPSIRNVHCSGNPIKTLDFTRSPNLSQLFAERTDLESLFLKNGALMIDDTTSNVEWLHLEESPKLSYICCDEGELDYVIQVLEQDSVSGCLVNSLCAFNRDGVFYGDGEYYLLKGNAYLAEEKDSCVSKQLFPDVVKYSIENEDGLRSTLISSSAAPYEIPLQEGSYEVVPSFQNAEHFIVDPEQFSVSFDSNSLVQTRDICITAKDPIIDLSISIIPKGVARPGFDAEYLLLFTNLGNADISGNITLNFDAQLVTFLSAIPAQETNQEGQITWVFEDLSPFESREISFSTQLASPMDEPALNDGDLIKYKAKIAPLENDINQTDNAFSLCQNIVNSHDPNDKTCLEGDRITEAMIGAYVHYLIRFENIGTAAAVNVRVSDLIDPEYFDIASLEIVEASHEMVTRITRNRVEFIFDQINLPFDDQSNDGFVVFKIKTLPSLTLGDYFENRAEIFFDFNFPIITNTARTEVSNFSTAKDLSEKLSFNIFPNPATDEVIVQSEELIENLTIKSSNGQALRYYKAASGTKRIFLDVGDLPVGLYFVELSAASGKGVAKLVVDK